MLGLPVYPPKKLTAIKEVGQAVLFRQICEDLTKQSYSIHLNAIPKALIMLLSDRVKSENGPHYISAGIGRKTDHHLNQNVRNDEIAWIDDDLPTDHIWIKWMETFRIAINRHLYMGLTSVESHYARYYKGGFYKKHIDAFSGVNNRKISLVLFLNEFWKVADEGELKLYIGPESQEEILISPHLGTLVVFLSNEIPHEVLPTNIIRNSIAAWYR